MLEGEADKIAHAAARDGLRSLYPMARVGTFPGAGHAISAQCREQWAADIASFLTEVPGTGAR